MVINTASRDIVDTSVIHSYGSVISGQMFGITDEFSE